VDYGDLRGVPSVLVITVEECYKAMFYGMIRYGTIAEFNVDSKAECGLLNTSTRIPETKKYRA